MKKKMLVGFIIVAVFACLVVPSQLFAGGSQENATTEKVTLNLLMEDVPDTHIIKELLPEFEEATGINVNFEIVQYTDMHTKLITQFMVKKSAYDVIEVDNYWAGEFPAGNWLEPLDEYVAKDNFDMSVYIPAMLDMVGYYKGNLYMIPMYNYTMALLYRNDIMNDPALQDAYKAQFNKELQIPQTLEEYVDLCGFIQANTDYYGSAMQAGKGDPISMEWSNYFFALGGRFYDENWHATINTPVAKEAIALYEKNLKTGAPNGATSYTLEDSLRLMNSGKAFSMISYNWMLAQFQDETSSEVAGKVNLVPIPGESGLAGGWGWGIASNSNKKDAAWTFIKWVESRDIAKRRALAGGAPTRYDVLQDADVLEAYPYYREVQEILEHSRPVPEFDYSTKMIESLGRELSLIVSSGKDPDDALATLEKEFNELAIKAGLQK